MIRTAFLAAFLAAASVTGAQAQSTGLTLGGFAGADTTAPVEVTADQLELDQAEGKARFAGDVLVIQGDLRLAAPQIVIAYARNDDGEVGTDVDTITASGGVTMVTLEEAAEAQQAVYSPLREELVLIGDVLLTQAGNTLSGEKLIIDLAANTGRMEGRVRTVLQPADQAAQ